MKRKTLDLVAVCCLLIGLVACAPKPNAETTDFKTLKLDLSRVEKEKALSQIFTDISLVKLETTPNSLIGDINGIFLKDNQIFLSDGLSIYIFDLTGKFIKRLYNSGNGPGEYWGISDFVIDADGNIDILSSGNQKVFRYDSTFTLIGDYSIGRYAMNMALLNQGVRLFHCGNDAPKEQSDKILYYQNGRLKEGFVKIDSLRSRYLHTRIFNIFSYYNNGVLTTDAHHDTVYFFKDGQLKPIYAMDIGSRAVPKNVYNTAYANGAVFSQTKIKGTGYLHGIYQFLESVENLFFRYYEKIEDKESVYGKARAVNVFYAKDDNTYDAFHQIADDVNFSGKPILDEFTSFFSQPDGRVAYSIQALDFIEMYNQGKAAQDDGEEYPADKLIGETKPTDNMFVVIGRLK